jgi:hypothetical protein
VVPKLSRVTSFVQTLLTREKKLPINWNDAHHRARAVMEASSTLLKQMAIFVLKELPSS